MRVGLVGHEVERMSIYGWFVCPDCKVLLWLGKAVFKSGTKLNRVDYFHIGDPSEPPNWAREELNRILWKMLADHAGHEFRVLFDWQLAELEEQGRDFVEIGGDSINDVSFEDYINDRWRPERNSSVDTRGTCRK